MRGSRTPPMLCGAARYLILCQINLAIGGWGLAGDSRAWERLADIDLFLLLDQPPCRHWDTLRGVSLSVPLGCRGTMSQNVACCPMSTSEDMNKQVYAFPKPMVPHPGVERPGAAAVNVAVWSGMSLDQNRCHSTRPQRSDPDRRGRCYRPNTGSAAQSLGSPETPWSWRPQVADPSR